MGYIEYLITYENGEEWSETRPFYDIEDMGRISSKEFCEALATEYGATSVFPMAIRADGYDLEQFMNVV